MFIDTAEARTYAKLIDVKPGGAFNHNNEWYILTDSHDGAYAEVVAVGSGKLGRLLWHAKVIHCPNAVFKPWGDK